MPTMNSSSHLLMVEADGRIDVIYAHLSFFLLFSMLLLKLYVIPFFPAF